MNIVIGLIILAIIAIPTTVYLSQNQQETRQRAQTITTPPITTKDLDQSLDKTSIEIQENLNQVDADLREIDLIDISDENTNGI